MKKDFILNLIFKYLLLSILVSCVPAQKFQEVETKYKNCSNELDVTKQKQEQLTVENTEMKQQISKDENQINTLIKDSLAKTNELDKAHNDFDKINKQYTELQDIQESILKGNARETAKLMKQLQTTQEDLKKQEENLKKNESALDDKKNKLDNLKLELEKRDTRLSELEKILFKKDSIVKMLRSIVSNALLGFGKEDLSVKIQNGKVYVSLEEKLLFKSGSTKVDPKGVEALKKLAQVLEQNPDINITIEGHTDNVPIKPGSDFKDNWDLSVQRATSIIRIILDNSNIDPKRLTASGRGEFSPVASNNSAGNKAKNRRTEIILTPKLDELFKILENN